MFIYRELEKTEYASAMELALDVFMKYEAPEFPEEGIQTFQKLIHDESFLQKIRCYGAFEADSGQLLGMIATREKGTHITLFFVEGQHHRKGIGRNLMEMVIADNTSGILTLNAAPYAVEIYKRLGFVTTGPEAMEDGIRSTPMVRLLKKETL